MLPRRPSKRLMATFAPRKSKGESLLDRLPEKERTAISFAVESLSEEDWVEFDTMKCDSLDWTKLELGFHDGSSADVKFTLARAVKPRKLALGFHDGSSADASYTVERAVKPRKDSIQKKEIVSVKTGTHVPTKAVSKMVWVRNTGFIDFGASYRVIRQ